MPTRGNLYLHPRRVAYMWIFGALLFLAICLVVFAPGDDATPSDITTPSTTAPVRYVP